MSDKSNGMSEISGQREFFLHFSIIPVGCIILPSFLASRIVGPGLFIMFRDFFYRILRTTVKGAGMWSRQG
jgi:hypothetical protein